MATNKENEANIKKAQVVLIDSFVNSLKNKHGKELRSKDQYRNVVNALNTEEIFGPWKGANFLDLLIRLIYFGQFKNWDKVEEIVRIMKTRLYEFKKEEGRSSEYKKSYKTYLNRFFDFLLNEECQKELSVELESLKFKIKMNAAAWAAFEAFKESNKGSNDEIYEVYLYSALRTKFKSRLRCQDRTSGDKIWLPLRFIAKLYSIAKKEGEIDTNYFSNWLDNLFGGICVHYIHYIDDNTQKVSHLTFNENLSLVFKKKKDEECYDVFVWLMKSEKEGDYEEYRVLTPTGKGNQKVPMKVKSITEIDIDHVKSIDATLREKEGELTELKKVSDFYKDMIEEDEYDENKKAKELYKECEDEKLDLSKLYGNLEAIRNDGLLRLMDSKYNSQKSNGETFQRIVKEGDNLIGILEERVNITDGTYRFYLYQELTDNYDDKVVYRVRRKTFPKDSVTVSENDIDKI